MAGPESDVSTGTSVPREDAHQVLQGPCQAAPQGTLGLSPDGRGRSLERKREGSIPGRGSSMCRGQQGVGAPLLRWDDGLWGLSPRPWTSAAETLVCCVQVSGKCRMEGPSGRQLDGAEAGQPVVRLSQAVLCSACYQHLLPAPVGKPRRRTEPAMKKPK